MSGVTNIAKIMAARPELTISPGAELAPVIPLDPSQSEEGFLKYQSLLRADPLSIVGSAWRGASQVRGWILGEDQPHSNPIPRSVTVELDDHNHLLLVTEPAPEVEVDPDDAANTLFKPGLTELADSGSALRLHVAFARRHPERRVISEATKGMSHTGSTFVRNGVPRQIDGMAAESLELIKRVSRDGPVEIAGTSLGTRLAVSMAEQNLAANPAQQLEIERLTFIASAVVASKVEGGENFRDPDLDEDEYRQSLSKRFQAHVADDLIRMLRTHPSDILSCWPNIAAYAMAHPRKSLERIQAITADYANVKQGVPWETLKTVVAGTDIKILGGSRDPLVQEQISQWDTLDALFPGRVQQRVVRGMGHLMSAAATETVGHLVEMDEQRKPLAEAV